MSCLPPSVTFSLLIKGQISYMDLLRCMPVYVLRIVETVEDVCIVKGHISVE